MKVMKMRKTKLQQEATPDWSPSRLSAWPEGAELQTAWLRRGGRLAGKGESDAPTTAFTGSMGPNVNRTIWIRTSLRFKAS